LVTTTFVRGKDEEALRSLSGRADTADEERRDGGAKWRASNCAEKKSLLALTIKKSHS
jgi:hypothetical protein